MSHASAARKTPPTAMTARGRRWPDRLFGGGTPPARMGIGWIARYLALAAALAAIVFARRPDALLRPQFWAEDGSVFFAQQLTLGFWPALGTLVAGFPFLVQRLIAGAAAGLPTVDVPLAYNASAIAITALTMATFALPRFRHLVRGDALRAAVCVGAVCIPAGQELLATPTTVGYFLAIWLVFLSVMQTPRTRTGAALWCIGSAAALLSTPVAPLVAPLWLLRLVHGLRSGRRADVVFGITQVAAVLAAAGLVSVLGGPTAFSAQRPGFAWQITDAGSTLSAFGWTAVDCLDTAVVPGNALAWLGTHGSLLVAAPAALIIVGVAWMFRRLRRSRAAMCLAAYVFASSLFLVIVSRGLMVRLVQQNAAHPSVDVLTVVGPRHRALAYAALLVLAAAIIDGVPGARLRRVIAAGTCAALVFAWWPEFRVPAFPDLQWPRWAARLDAKRASGSREPLVIPSYPPLFNISIDVPAPAAGAPRAAEPPRTE